MWSWMLALLGRYKNNCPLGLHTLTISLIGMQLNTGNISNNLSEYTMVGENAFVEYEHCLFLFPGRWYLMRRMYNFYMSQLQIKIECALANLLINGLFPLSMPNNNVPSIVLQLMSLNHFFIDLLEGALQVHSRKMKQDFKSLLQQWMVL